MLPFVQQRQRLRGVADFIAEIIRNAAIGVDIVEMLMQMLRQKPRHYRKVFVVTLGQALAVGIRLSQRRSRLGSSILRRQRLPASLHIRSLRTHCATPFGRIAVLISLLRLVSLRSTSFRSRSDASPVM